MSPRTPVHELADSSSPVGRLVPARRPAVFHFVFSLKHSLSLFFYFFLKVGIYFGCYFVILKKNVYLWRDFIEVACLKVGLLMKGDNVFIACSLLG